jgi:hypothetical protein
VAATTFGEPALLNHTEGALLIKIEVR